jgi:hypothetical protein
MPRLYAMAVLALALAGCGGGGGSAGPQADVVLDAANGSGIEGTASVERVSPTSTRVTIGVAGLTGSSPAALVTGECGGFTAPDVVRKLSPLVDGRSETTVPLSFDEITGTGYVIAVKRGTDYVTCGSIVP